MITGAERSWDFLVELFWIHGANLHKKNQRAGHDALHEADEPVLTRTACAAGVTARPMSKYIDRFVVCCQRNLND